MTAPSPAIPGAVQRGSLELAKKTKPFSIIDFVWRRAPLILGAGIPVFLVLGLFLPLFSSPVYTVDAKVLITPTKAPTIDGRDRELIQGDVGWFARTLVLRLTNPDILRAALRKVPDDKRPKFLRGLGDSDKAVFVLMSRIKSLEIQRTYMIKISLSGSDAAGLAEMLNAVLDTFIERLQAEQERQYLSQLNYLKNEREKMADRVSREKESLVGIARELDSNAFLNEGYAGHLDKLRLVQDLYWTAQGVAVDKKEKYEQARKDREEIQKMSIDPFADAEVSNFLGINQMEQWTYVETQGLRKSIEGLTTDNSDRKNVEERMKSMLEYLKTYKEKVATDTKATFGAKRAYEFDADIIRARTAYEAAQSAADRLQGQLKEAESEASKVAEAMFRGSEFSYGVTQFRNRLASIDARVDDAELEAKAPLPVLIDQHALVPERPASSNASKLQMFALVVSFGLIGGICVVFDFFDSRIRSRAELGAAIGGPGCEPVCALLPGGVEDPEFPALLGGAGPAASAIRDFAVRLVVEHQTSGARVIDMVGIHGRSGNSAVTLTLARALAGHGLRVLAAELPCPSPGLARLADLSGNLPKGAWASKSPDPSSSAQLLPWVVGTPEDDVRSTLEKFLSSARSGYDIVLLDSPALKTSDIAHEVALKSDVVVLVARQDVGRFGDARHIVEWCAAGGVPAITALLNFSESDPLRARAEQLFQKVMDFASRFHDEAVIRLGKLAGTLKARLPEKFRRKP